jgi:hypothetical protein
MQQWEDWRPGQDWQLLLEKAVATSVVIALSYLTWTYLSAARAEAAVPFAVEIPALLKGGIENDLKNDGRQVAPTEEASPVTRFIATSLTIYRSSMGGSTPSRLQMGGSSNASPLLPPQPKMSTKL